MSPVGRRAIRGQTTAESSKDAAPKKDVLWIIPHSHWEGAVFKTREEYLEMGLVNITAALHLLAEHPEYRFVLDQVAYVRPYLERYPENAPVSGNSSTRADSNWWAAPTSCRT